MAVENIYKLPLILDPQPEGGWTITCPILPGLVTEADTVEEISVNVTDAIEALLEAYEELGASWVHAARCIKARPSVNRRVIKSLWINSLAVR